MSNGQVRGESYSSGCLGQTGRATSFYSVCKGFHLLVAHMHYCFTS